MSHRKLNPSPCFQPSLPLLPPLQASPLRLQKPSLSRPSRPAVPVAALSLDPTKSLWFFGSQAVGDEGAAAIAAALAGAAVTSIHLESNGVGDAGAAALAAALRGNRRVEELLLADNEVGDAGAAALGAALAHNPVLRVLSLARNRVGPAGGAALGRAVGPGGLQVVYLMGMDRKGAGIGDEGVEGWVEGIRENVARGGKFWFLNCSGNGISEKGLQRLKSVRTQGRHVIFPVDPYPGYKPAGTFNVQDLKNS